MPLKLLDLCVTADMVLAMDANTLISKAFIDQTYSLPLIELIGKARRVHEQHFAPNEVQLCKLVSVKTGGCTEDCGYCSQSIHNKTAVEPEKLMSVDEVRELAKQAKASGATRFCMGAAWPKVREGKAFQRVIEMVREVADLGLEPCCTLGMLTHSQATQLKDAGLYAYNHNLDTSPEHYQKIISTRTFEQRLETIENVRKAGITVCSGFILGMGESEQDRVSMLATIANLSPQPESVPVNTLVAVQGTPLQDAPPLSCLALARFIATARILMPKTMLRLSAGRLELSDEGQLLCFFAGANSIFFGNKLLTTPNPNLDQDLDLFNRIGIEPMKQQAHS